MRHSQEAKKRITAGIAVCLLTAGIALAAYDPGWTKNQCDAYSYHGINERYVYGANTGWIDNNTWDSPTVEGVDCAAYVCRSLALPQYVAEGTAAPYPYTTTYLYEGVANTVQVTSINALQQWDLWVYVSGTSRHTGLFKQYSGSYIITREARNAESGVVEGKFSKQYLLDKGARFWRRANWSSAPLLPTVKTVAATGVLYSSATLNATITSDGNAAIDELGFAWGRTSSCSDGWVDGTLSSGDNFSCTITGLNPSTTYYFKAQVHNSVGWGSGAALSFVTDPAPVSSGIIIDNGKTGTSSTGTWSVSGAENPYGVNSLWARDGATYTWSFDSQPAGFYDVSMWWTEFSSRGSAIPVTVNYADGTAEMTVNQQIAGGRWNILGEYYFDGGGSVTLTADGSYPTSAAADAVKFALVQANKRPVATIVSIAPTSFKVGDYATFTGLGTDDGSISAYEWVSSINGKFATSSSVTTSVLSEGTHLISFRVRDNLGIWSVADEETLTVSGSSPSEIIIIDNRDSQTASVGSWPVSGGADPYGNDSVYARDPGLSFSWVFTPSESGTYDVSMWWTEFSSRSTAAPVEIQHTSGTASKTVNQQTNGGTWNGLGQYRFNAGTTYRVTIRTLTDNSSISADAVRFVLAQTAPPPVVIDNRDPQTASVGSWPVSGGADPYGSDSVYARDPGLSFSWVFTPSESGTYDVSMWWTEFSSRSTAAPVEIQHASGAASKTVNQQTNGGTWNGLGQYSFTAGTAYRVTIRTKTDNSSISADAVQFVKVK